MVHHTRWCVIRNGTSSIIDMSYLMAATESNGPRYHHAQPNTPPSLLPVAVRMNVLLQGGGGDGAHARSRRQFARNTLRAEGGRGELSCFGVTFCSFYFILFYYYCGPSTTSFRVIASLLSVGQLIFLEVVVIGRMPYALFFRLLRLLY